MPTKSTHNIASNYPRFANMRVPNLSLHSEVNTNGNYRAELGAPPAAVVNGIFSNFSINTQTIKSNAGLIPHRQNMGRFGRGVSIAMTAGAGAPIATIFGLDYLGQAMSEDITGNGTTPVSTKKAFKEVLYISCSTGAGLAINIGWSNVLGLPFATNNITEEYVDQVIAAAGTKVYALLTTQGAATADPRGTYTPNAANLPNGTRNFVLVGQAIEGDYHGMPHFTS